MTCNTGHGVVGASESQAQHVRGMPWESWGTFGRSQAVMWCFGMRHFASWWMTIVCVRLASLGASSRVSGRTGPATGGTGSCFEPVGVYGGVAGMGWGVLLFEVSVGCLHVFASWQSVSRCSCRLREVLVEEGVLRPFGKL